MNYQQGRLFTAIWNNNIDQNERKAAAQTGNEILALLQEKQLPHIIAKAALSYVEAALDEMPITSDKTTLESLQSYQEW